MQNDEMARAVDSLAEPTDLSMFVASNGLRLKLKRVSKMVMLDASRRIVAPKPPRTFSEEKQREEENPLDPTFVEAMRNYNYDIGMLAVTTYFVLGTKIDGELPEGVEAAESNDWVDMLKVVDPDVDVPETRGPRRYLSWLKYYALSDDDQNRLLRQCVRYSGGTMEADVEAALASFRSQQARDPANGVHAPDGGGLGDNPGTDAGNGAGIRSEGSGGLRPRDVGPVDEANVF